jgi:uncharacterized membrane protein HdeD (DUF308 family)
MIADSSIDPIPHAPHEHELALSSFLGVLHASILPRHSDTAPCAMQRTYRWLLVSLQDAFSWRATLKHHFTGSSQKGNLMSDAVSEAKSAFTSLRVALAVSGVIALVLGILLLVWPGKSAGVLTWILALYLVIAGLVYVGLGIFSATKGGWARVGHVLLGILYVVAGVVAFANIAAATAFIAVIVVIFIGISWIIDGIVSLTLIAQAASKGWTIAYAIISIIGGVLVILSPLFTALVIWWILGIALIAIGILQIVRAITLGRDAKSITNEIAADLS